VAGLARVSGCVRVAVAVRMYPRSADQWRHYCTGVPRRTLDLGMMHLNTNLTPTQSSPWRCGYQNTRGSQKWFRSRSASASNTVNANKKHKQDKGTSLRVLNRKLDDWKWEDAELFAFECFIRSFNSLKVFRAKIFTTFAWEIDVFAS
jgi:hypothetical protein